MVSKDPDGYSSVSEGPVKARNDGWVRTRPVVGSTVLLWTRDMTCPKGIATEKKFLCSRGESWAGLWSG